MLMRVGSVVRSDTRWMFERRTEVSDGMSLNPQVHAEQWP